MTSTQDAQAGLRLIESAVVSLLRQKGDWTSRSQIADELGIESEYEGAFTGFLVGAVVKALSARGVLDEHGGASPGQPMSYRLRAVSAGR
jgi:hypothetical protein